MKARGASSCGPDTPAPEPPCGLGGTCELPTAPAACDDDDAGRRRERHKQLSAKRLLKTAEGQLSVQTSLRISHGKHFTEDSFY